AIRLAMPDSRTPAVRFAPANCRVLDHLDERNAYSVMNLKFSTLLIGLSMLLLTQTKPLVGQQIPASELPPPGSDTGLEGKYDPQNGIAQLIQDKSAESAASKIF